ncbi:outer membrane efflux protein [Paludibacter propionicigenes WB4]|uniref:Outer membrane efflux protein n=1 Tax=Paludibacter propionicigenes (strain DSM 17365 / JCM 13257 / WB4) TaxID=694427 RepID=E4T1F6_PALPW|nr:TolC family protein [Paludibacter propionicigenes]ADQ78550.1 outer membrane efflux protein [Paludibacter propionicigenes WB4]
MKNKTIDIMKISVLFILFLGCTTVGAQNKLTIEDAIKTALKKNFDIRVAENDAEITRVNNTAGNAGMLPTVALTGSGNYSVNNSTQKLSNGTETNIPSLSTTALSAGAQLSWNLFDGGKMFVTKSKLNEIQALGEIQFKEKVTQTLYNVIAAYYNVVRQKQQLNSIKEALNYNFTRVTIAQTGYNAGSRLKSELLQSKIDMNVTTENVINQEFAIDEALKTLNLLLGKSATESIEISDSIPLGYEPDRALLFNKLNKSNASILNFQKQIEIANLALKESRASYLPTLSLKGGYYASRTVNSAGSLLQNNSNGPQVGGTLVIPLYNAGETRRKETTAKIQAQSAELDLQNIKLQVNTELTNTLTEFENQQQLLKIESENNQLAKENLQISIDRLKHGQATSLEVHLAQEDYVQSNTRLINFRYNLKLAETKLKQLVSEL